MYTHYPIQLWCDICQPPTQSPSWIFFKLALCKVYGFQFQFVALSFIGYWHYLPPWQQHIITLGDPSFSFFFDGFNYFFCFPSRASSSFDTLGPFAMEVNLWCFASYIVSGFEWTHLPNDYINYKFLILLFINFCLAFN